MQACMGCKLGASGSEYGHVVCFFEHGNEIRVLQNAKDFLTSRGTSSFSRWTPLCRVQAKVHLSCKKKKEVSLQFIHQRIVMR
jgi:hypothetical protein